MGTACICARVARDGEDWPDPSWAGVRSRLEVGLTAEAGGLPVGVDAVMHSDGVEVGAEAVQDEGGDVGQGARVTSGFEGDVRVAEAERGDPVIVETKADRANVQNKVPPDRSDICGEVRAGIGREHCGDAGTAHERGEACGEMRELEEFTERHEVPIAGSMESGPGWQLTQTPLPLPISGTGGE
jgi:hypothetical protein